MTVTCVACEETNETVSRRWFSISFSDNAEYFPHDHTEACGSCLYTWLQNNIDKMIVIKRIINPEAYS